MKRALFLFPLAAIQASAAPAAAKSAAAAIQKTDLTLWELLMAGGWVMIPLFLASFAAIVLILFYFITIRTRRVATPELIRSYQSIIYEGQFARLLEAARSNPQMISRVMERVTEFHLNNPTADVATLREVAQAEGSRQATGLHQSVVYLMDIGVLAPMLGLFGTVVGILRSFGSIASEATPMRTMLLAGGVSQALVSTAAGLLVGITAMCFYSYFRGRTQGLISELESGATLLVAQMSLKVKS